jgi:hypothetical protein
MKRHWNYFKYLIRHKWFVAVACRRLGIPIWVAIMHDLSKFRPSEWFPYARTFYTSNGEKQYIETEAFNLAWLLHQHRNPHHWQYWILRMDKPKMRYAIQDMGDFEGGSHIHDFKTGAEIDVPQCGLNANRPDVDRAMRDILKYANEGSGLISIRMPRRYALEMVADWMGAGRAITGKWEAGEWYKQNKSNIKLHLKTMRQVEEYLTPVSPVSVER